MCEVRDHEEFQVRVRVSCDYLDVFVIVTIKAFTRELKRSYA